jgi:tetratricopeptide (TPR) repeat protein
MLRDLHGLLHAAEGAAQSAAEARPLSVPATSEWASSLVRRGAFPQALLALAALRLARQYDEAEKFAEELQSGCPSEWQSALANERAALAWHRGRREEAAAQWRSQTASVPVLFNRGVAALFLGRPAEARTELSQAVAQLSEDSGWHHLGRLYLALAEMRG